MPGGNDKVEVKAKAKIPAKMLKKSSPGPISDDPHDSGVDSGGGGAPGGYGASHGTMGDGVGLTIIFLGKRHSNMAKRAK